MRDGHESTRPNDWDEIGEYEAVPDDMRATAPEDDQADASYGDFAPDDNDDQGATRSPGLVINGGDDTDGGVL
jgi:hypothetical protein